MLIATLSLGHVFLRATQNGVDLRSKEGIVCVTHAAGAGSFGGALRADCGRAKRAAAVPPSSEAPAPPVSCGDGVGSGSSSAVAEEPWGAEDCDQTVGILICDFGSLCEVRGSSVQCFDLFRLGRACRFKVKREVYILLF